MKTRFTISLLSLALLATHCPAADEPQSKAAAPPANPETATTIPTKEELEKKFQETLSGATLTGNFTSNRDAAGAPLKEDKYTLESVSKLAGDLWLFKARIQYGKNDVTVPLPLKVLWAGDTPIITVDKMPVPGLGSYSARVMVYDGKYLGTWDGGNHGGMLFGKISKEPDKSQDKKDAK